MSPVAEYLFNGVDTWLSFAGRANESVTPGTVETAGAMALGSTSYPIPAGAVFLATNGSDANPGTLAAPKATLQAAINAAPAGGTVVVRGGVYTQKYTGNQVKQLTVQSYPGEVVWFDGTSVVTGFTQSGSTWVKTNWTYQFDHSASYTYGSDAGGFVGTQNPMAAWPDLVFIDGARKWLVANNPGPGQYAVDYTNHLLVLGDDPTGHEVRATTLDIFMVVSAAMTIRGIGIRRYATPMPAMGTLNIVAAGSGTWVEQCFFQDVATQLIAIGSPNARTTVTRCTFTGGGQLCIEGNNTSGTIFTISNCVLNDSNWRLFNIQPSAGALKTSRALNAIVINNVVTNSQGAGIWFDVYCRNSLIANNYIDTCTGAAIEYEISQWALICGNTVRNTGSAGIQALASADVRIWNNTVDRCWQYDMAFEDDSRSTSEFGVVPYIYRGEMHNNVITNEHAKSTAGWRLVVYDISYARNSNDFMVSGGISGNLFTADQAPTGATSSARSGSWCNGGGNTTIYSYSTPSSFQAAHPTYVGANALTAIPSPSAADLVALAPTLAVSLPQDVAEAMGVSVGAKILGPGRAVPTAI